MNCNIHLAYLFIVRLYYQPKVKEKEPHLAAKEFIKTFKSKYGDKHVGFYRGGYGKALEKAKRELRFLLVMLHDKSNDTTRFCR
jgi:hypothetical protein